MILKSVASLHVEKAGVYLFTDIQILQRYADSFWGDDVLESVNMENRDKYSISEQIYEKQICSDLYYEDIKVLQQTTHKIGFL